MNITVNPLKQDWAILQQRVTIGEETIVDRVEEILRRVKLEGDCAVMALTKEIDGVSLDSFTVAESEVSDAVSFVPDELKRAMDVAAENIRKFHTAQLPTTVDIETTSGVRCMQKAIAIQRIGLYVPAGSAPLFSTVLMLAIPAQVAGCKEIILCTPPNKKGKVAPEILYAARLCGVTNIYKIGGAQAIVAMAYGTESIPKVDKIFGPGNRYVTLAKQLVSTTEVAIDMPAGPSEVMILADSSAKPEFVAADMLSQAEHGADSQAILVANCTSFAERVVVCLQGQLKSLGREDTACKALTNSRIVVFDHCDDMVSFANQYAAEHLIISMNEPWKVAEQITAAGSIFIGNYTPESAGDYASGTNHTLPTYGWAKSYSGVNIDSFVRKVTIQEMTIHGLQNLAPTIVTMAMAEGLDAHAKAVEIRINDLKNG